MKGQEKDNNIPWKNATKRKSIFMAVIKRINEENINDNYF